MTMIENPDVEASYSEKLASSDPRVSRRGFRWTSLFTADEAVEECSDAKAGKANADE